MGPINHLALPLSLLAFFWPFLHFLFDLDGENGDAMARVICSLLVIENVAYFLTCAHPIFSLR